MSVTSPSVDAPRSYSSQKRGIRSERMKLKNSWNSCVDLFFVAGEKHPAEVENDIFHGVKIAIFSLVRDLQVCVRTKTQFMNHGISILFRAIPLAMAAFCFGYGAYVFAAGSDPSRLTAGPVVFSSARSASRSTARPRPSSARSSAPTAPPRSIFSRPSVTLSPP